MKRVPVLVIVFGMSLTAVAEMPLSQQMVESHGLGDFYSNKTHKTSLSASGWDYVTGLVANAVLKTWEQYPEKTAYYDAVKSFADRSTNSDGSMVVNSGGTSALGKSNLDDLAAGKIFFTLYGEELKKGDLTEANRFRNAATVIRNKLKYEHARIAAGLPGAGGFYHKASYPDQMWLDGLYMGPAVYAQWQYVFGKDSLAGNEAAWSDIALQFKILHTYTYDTEKQLNYHAWTATPADANAFWSNQTAPFKGCSKEFWGRSMGWYFAGLTDVLEMMPADHPDRPVLLANYQQVAAGLKRWQDVASGVWFQLLQYDGTKKADGTGDLVGGTRYNIGTTANYLEASCSCMFAYAFFKGVRLGLLDKSTYLPVAEKAYAGLLNTFVKKNGDNLDIIQSCASAGLGPKSNLSRTGTVNYYLCGSDVGLVQNEGKAIGPFILASLEKERADSALSVIHSQSRNALKACTIIVPTNGVYLIRMGDATSTMHKIVCRKGQNTVWLEDVSAEIKGHFDVFSGIGRMIARYAI
ncbi:MAG: glycoside hydrolase family 88 protein [Bacteroidota bacterium]|nr:glycoside hydrolase family 88 protein [Bacteroidota bacterium]